MAKHFLDKNGNYYETIEDVADTPQGAIVVPQRPGPYDTWDGSKWVTGTAPVADIDAEDTTTLNQELTAQGSIVRAMGEALFELINEVRPLDGKAPITKAQFIAYLKGKMRG